MGWSGGATIGFTASDELYDNLRLSGTSQVTPVACLNSPTTEWSNLLYRLTPESGTLYSAFESECVRNYYFHCLIVYIHNYAIS